MLIRSAVAALDFNFNVNRKTKVSADGQPRYKIKVKLNLVTRRLCFGLLNQILQNDNKSNYAKSYINSCIGR